MYFEKYKNNNSLDAIRVISAYGIVVVHTLLIQPLDVPKYVHVLDLLAYCVQIFFVLSALSLLLNNNFETVLSVKNYFIKRFFRIIPLFYFFIILYSLKYSIFNPHKLLINLTLTFELFGDNLGFVWAGWTMGIDAIFYFILPIIYIIINSRFYRLIFLTSIVPLSLFFHGHLYHLNPTSTYYQASFLANMGCFALGALIAEALRWEKNPNPISLSTKTALYVVACVLCVIIICDYLLVLGPYWYNRRTFYGFVGALIIYAEMKRPSSILRGLVWHNLAKLSYGIYLWNPFIIYHLKGIYDQVYEQINTSNTAAFAVCVLLTMVVTTIVASITYVCIERPAIAYGRRITSSKNNNLNAAIA